MKSILEIVIIVCVALTLILVSYFTQKNRPKEKSDAMPKSQRIFTIAGGVIIVATEWTFFRNNSLFDTVITNLFGIYLIYIGLKDWLFKSRVKEEDPL